MGTGQYLILWMQFFRGGHGEARAEVNARYGDFPGMLSTAE